MFLFIESPVIEDTHHILNPHPPSAKTTTSYQLTLMVVLNLNVICSKVDLAYKLNMKNIDTKSVNMRDITVYLAMFGTTIDNILCFWVFIR